MKKKRKSPLTIIEIMIVITIISIVGGLMTYNMKGSLAKGRSFKSEAASKEAYDILTLQLSTDSTIADIIANPKGVIVSSGLVKNANKLMTDGWGNEFQILELDGGNDIILYSERWIDYLKTDKKMTEKAIQDNYPWAYNKKAVEAQQQPQAESEGSEV